MARSLGGDGCDATPASDAALPLAPLVRQVDVFSLKSFEPSSLAEKLLEVHQCRSRQLERALPLAAAAEAPRAEAGTRPDGNGFSLSYWLRERELAKGRGGERVLTKAEPKEPKLADLVDLSHWEGIPTEVQMDLLAMAYTRDRTLYKHIDEVATSLEDPARLQHAAHTLFGSAQTAGAAQLAAEVKLFKAAPSVEGVASLRRILSLTHRQLQDLGALP